MNLQILVNHLTLLAWTLGLCSGALVALINISLSLRIQKKQMKWGRAIWILIFFPVIFAVFLGAGVFLMINNSTDLKELHQAILFMYIVVTFSSSNISVSYHRHLAQLSHQPTDT